MNKLLFEINVDSHVSKKNSRPIFRTGGGKGRAFIGKSPKLVHAEAYLTQELRREWAAYCKALKRDLSPIDYPIHVKFTFMFKDYYTKHGVMSKKLPDLSNLYELPQDALQRAGIIENDVLIFSHDGSRREPCKSNTLLIEISTFEAIYT